MKGKLIVAGKPIANEAIEICDTPSTLTLGPTPCSDGVIHFQSKTDAEGGFAFKDIPRQPYGIAFKDHGKWMVVFGSQRCCTEMAAGAEVDVGEVKLDK